jgi:hypothetical protein
MGDSFEREICQRAALIIPCRHNGVRQGSVAREWNGYVAQRALDADAGVGRMSFVGGLGDLGRFISGSIRGEGTGVLTRRLVVATPWAPLGKLRMILVVSSQPVASYFVMDDVTVGGPRLSSGTTL